MYFYNQAHSPPYSITLIPPYLDWAQPFPPRHKVPKNLYQANSTGGVEPILSTMTPVQFRMALGAPGWTPKGSLLNACPQFFMVPFFLLATLTCEMLVVPMIGNCWPP